MCSNCRYRRACAAGMRANIFNERFDILAGVIFCDKLLREHFVVACELGCLVYH